MKKLVQGLLDFQRHGLPAYRATFARLAHGQSPDCLFIACSDSRVVPNLFVSTDPGDLFVMRNVGNMVPPSDATGLSLSDRSEAAALEFSLLNLPVKDIVVCGHSGCGAMKAILSGYNDQKTPNLSSWLDVGRPALAAFERGGKLGEGLPPYDRLSQYSVLQQLAHLRTYPLVRERLAAGTLRLHGWWFDIGHARVHAYRPDLERFAPIDELEGERMLAELESSSSETSSSAA
ncbi:carbonic anhydrase [Archangium lansingense]|uniref:carbonic anhydrase n=1 Tax=Archangium lansingense TaxID=2995310 RepID=A0ABT4AMU0_9BACT|nr:carbonic anhydrase [Archangium lansinium]MCY1082147.1 carbonic anhydrase [Archangium lansinium]